ncbi:MAG TPA: phosphonate metabolism protein/1,5-bisphosphokinase (PRPP-forming) PhnN [Mucilaginibacter sp.]
MSKLFYVIGASGVGKDTLMNYARKKINGTKPVVFAHRYITRAPGDGSENHVSLSHEEFKSRFEGGAFALYWESHGNYYGIGTEINSWMQKGFNVVVNGSRQYLDTARLLYPDMVVVLVEASPEIINQRLQSRGRENEEEIKSRIKRTSEITADLCDCTRVQNDGAIEEAGDELVSIITNVKVSSHQEL